MPLSKRGKRNLAVAVAALAAPAFAFVTFDALVRTSEGQPYQVPNLIETYRRAEERVAATVRGAGERWRAVGGERGQDAAPESPSATAPVAPESIEVPILIYHNVRDAKGAPAVRPYDVTPDELAAHFAYLAAEGFTPVTVSSALAAFEGATLPAKPVIITFDDGRADQYANAVPLLKKHGFVATFYVFTNAIGRPGYLTWEQLEELAAAGHEIGSHAVYHPYLTKADDATLKAELERSKAVLEERLGAIRAFAYPFGLVDDRVIEATRTAGYSSARGLEHSRVIRSDARLNLPGYITTGSLPALRGIVGGGRAD